MPAVGSHSHEHLDDNIYTDTPSGSESQKGLQRTLTHVTVLVSPSGPFSRNTRTSIWQQESSTQRSQLNSRKLDYHLPISTWELAKFQHAHGREPRCTETTDLCQRYLAPCADGVLLSFMHQDKKDKKDKKDTRQRVGSTPQDYDSPLVKRH